MAKRVLVIEDDPINIELMREMLSRFECEVEVAENGQDGVRAALGAPSLDLIFLDLHMPEMDGLTAAKAMREGKVRAPIIALTANVLSGVKTKCLEAGMNDYLAKPVELEDIERVLKKYLGG